MWIEKSNNKYRACAYYTDPLTMATHKIGVTIDKNTPQQRNKAKTELDRLILEKSNYTPASVTLEKLIDDYLAYQKKTVKLSTYTRNFYVCNSFKKLLGSGADISRLTARAVRSRFMAVIDRPTRYNEYIGRFKALIRWAYKNDYVNNIDWLNKLERVSDKTPREKVIDKFLEYSDCRKLIDKMKVKDWKYLTEFLLLSGLRIGEALALTWSDISFKDKEISVEKTLDPNNKIITTTKTVTSSRLVFMQKELYDLTRYLRLYDGQKRKKLGISTPLVFFSATGGYAEYDAYRKYLREKSIAVLGRPCTPHILRHTHASLLAETLPYDVISRRLGHSNSRITREIYIHITEQRKKRDNDLISSVHFG